MYIYSVGPPGLGRSILESRMGGHGSESAHVVILLHISLVLVILYLYMYMYIAPFVVQSLYLTCTCVRKCTSEGI